MYEYKNSHTKDISMGVLYDNDALSLKILSSI